MAKILIVEDKAEDFERIAEFLKNKGFQIVGAKNGYEGLYQFDKESPDMVIVDWNMPGLPGTEVCRTIKEKNKQMPILLLTIQSQLQHKREGFQAGCDDYLVKPCDVEELLARVQHLLSKLQKPVPQKLTYGDIALDPQTHRVSRGGKVIDLSLTEYSLLEYLMQNVDQVLSRKAILEHVWGTNNPDTFTNIVDVYMNYLRKKLDAPGRRSLIKTVRGFGYMLEDLSLRKAA
ncbi:MAG: response regulator transcription factor [Deltaproteobacteria bacterium]|nr:response regulator transcription factor [Deltaproteobacteria bacterium]